MGPIRKLGILRDAFIELEPGQANKQIPEDVISRLAIADAVIVRLFVLIAAFLISRYSLRSKRVAEIQQASAERRQSVW